MSARNVLVAKFLVAKLLAQLAAKFLIAQF